MESLEEEQEMESSNEESEKKWYNIFQRDVEEEQNEINEEFEENMDVPYDEMGEFEGEQEIELLRRESEEKMQELQREQEEERELLRRESEEEIEKLRIKQEKGISEGVFQGLFTGLVTEGLGGKALNTSLLVIVFGVFLLIIYYKSFTLAGLSKRAESLHKKADALNKEGKYQASLSLRDKARNLQERADKRGY